MALKDLFRPRRKSTKPTPGGVPKQSVDDLMILERWDEAEKVLQGRLKANSRDTHSLRKMADLYAKTGRIEDATEHYRLASDQMARDGFHDKAIAMLAKAAKVDPGNTGIAARIEELRQLKSLEQRGTAAVSALREESGAEATKWVRMQQYWRRLAGSEVARALDEEQVGRLVRVMEIVRFAADAPIARKGDRVGTLYLVATGEIKAAYRFGSAKPTDLRSFGPADIFGDRWLFEQAPAIANYEAAKDSVVLALDRAGLESVLQGNPDPRQVLNALRSQKRDHEVEALVNKLSGS